MALDRAPSTPQANRRFVDLGGIPTLPSHTVLEEMWRQVVAGFVIVPCVATGTANAIVLTPRLHKEGAANLGDHMAFAFVAGATSTGPVTVVLQTPGAAAGAFPIVKVYKNGGATQAGAGDIVTGVLYLVLFNDALDSGAGGYVIMGGGGSAAPGAWASYVPVITGATGTITLATATGRWTQVGKTTFVEIDLTITTNGTGGTAVDATLPVAGNGFSAFSGRDFTSGKMLQGVVSGATLVIFNYDNSYPGADGERLVISGSYEAA